MALQRPDFLQQFADLDAQGQAPKAKPVSRYDRMRQQQKAKWEEQRQEKADAQQPKKGSAPPKGDWGDVTYKMKQTQEMRDKYGGKAGKSTGKYAHAGADMQAGRSTGKYANIPTGGGGYAETGGQSRYTGGGTGKSTFDPRQGGGRGGRVFQPPARKVASRKRGSIGGRSSGGGMGGGAGGRRAAAGGFR
jgi:hypothetical protein